MVVLNLACATVQAEPDAADYKVEQVVPARAAREQARAQVERERRQSARRERAEAERAELRRAKEGAAQARRPYPQKLLQARCTACHQADQFLDRTHTQLGWHAVVARMRILNLAPLTWQEQCIVTGELARLRPATTVDAVIEYGLATALLALPPALAWRVARWRRHRRA